MGRQFSHSWRLWSQNNMLDPVLKSNSGWSLGGLIRKKPNKVLYSRSLFILSAVFFQNYTKRSFQTTSPLQICSFLKSIDAETNLAVLRGWWLEQLLSLSPWDWQYTKATNHMTLPRFVKQQLTKLSFKCFCFHFKRSGWLPCNTQRCCCCVPSGLH